MKLFKNISGIANIRDSFKTKHVKYGGYAAMITLAVIIGLILFNLMMGQLSLQIDLTQDQIFSLSEQTLHVLDQVDTPVRIYGLWRPGEEVLEVMYVIDLYLSRSRNVSFQVVDPNRNPGFVTRYDRDRRGIEYGSLIVEGSMGFRVIGPSEMFDSFNWGMFEFQDYLIERRISSAILFVGTGVTPVIYDLIGHEIMSMGHPEIISLLDRENYEVRELNLLLSDIPDDASIIVLCGPQRDLSSVEAEKLLNFLENGGRFFVMANYQIQNLTNLNSVLASYGISFDYGRTIENDPSYIVPSFYEMLLPDLAMDHDITRNLSDKWNTPVILYEPMSISEVLPRRREVEISSLIVSSPRSFLRSDVELLSLERLPDDLPGPLMLGAAAAFPGDNWRLSTDTSPQTRIVAIGDPYIWIFGIDAFGANLDVFMNSIAWLDDRPETTTIRSKIRVMQPMTMTMVHFIVYSVILIAAIPLAFFVSGLIVWLKRRHL